MSSLTDHLILHAWVENLRLELMSPSSHTHLIFHCCFRLQCFQYCCHSTHPAHHPITLSHALLGSRALTSKALDVHGCGNTNTKRKRKIRSQFQNTKIHLISFRLSWLSISHIINNAARQHTMTIRTIHDLHFPSLVLKNFKFRRRFIRFYEYLRSVLLLFSYTLLALDSCKI